MVIPDFAGFSAQMAEIFNYCKGFKGGKLADYIPQLAKQNPNYFGLAVCTVDGQRYQTGDVTPEFCIQSCSKPITYAMALEEFGVKKVHKHCGMEPSGSAFNALQLNKTGLPHNPLINSGAIMMCSLVKKANVIADRFEAIINMWSKLAAYKHVGFDMATYLSEKGSADRNFALSYFMNEKGAFPENTDLQETLELYFQCCSILMNADALSIVAATLANGGVNPLTKE